VEIVFKSVKKKIEATFPLSEFEELKYEKILEQQSERVRGLRALCQEKQVGREILPVMKTIGCYHFILSKSLHPEAVYAIHALDGEKLFATIGFLFFENKKGEQRLVITNIQGVQGMKKEIQAFRRFLKGKTIQHALVETLVEAASKTGVHSIYGLPATAVRELYGFPEKSQASEAFEILNPKSDLEKIYDETFEKNGFKLKNGLYVFKPKLRV